MWEYTRRPESRQAQAANDASGPSSGLEEFRRAGSAAPTHGFHTRKLLLGFNSSLHVPYMADNVGLLVNAVRNFGGSAFVPQKNQGTPRATVELPRAVNGGSFSTWT